MSAPFRLYTIGFTQTTARRFFERLERAGVRTVLDTRLNNVSQLAGFAKRDDLAFFLDRVAGIGYRHETRLAPTHELLDGYKKKRIGWDEYERGYLDLLRSRNVASEIGPEAFRDACLLCSEATPERCHRRLAADHLRDAWDGVEVVHL